MSIKELYEMAVKLGVENYVLRVGEDGIEAVEVDDERNEVKFG